MQTDRIEGFQLSPQQERLWLLQAENRGLQFGVHGAILVEGAANPSMLRSAIEDVARRHEILRTGFRSWPGMTIPLQVVTESVPQWSAGHDWSDLNEGEREARTMRMLSPSPSPWDLEAGRVLRADLVTLSPREWLLFVHLPALCADAASLRYLVSEIGRSYTGPRPPEEPDAAGVQYADVSAWQKALLEKQDSRANRFFRKQNLRAIPVPKLPLEKASRAEAGYSPASTFVELNSQLIDKMEAVAASERASLAAFLLSCWQVLLWRLTGVADLLVGMAGDGRSHEELKGVLGLLGQYLPVRRHLDANKPFTGALFQAEKAIRAVRGFQEYFDWREVRISRGLADRVAYWPFGFDFVDHREIHSARDLEFSILYQRARVDRFHVRLSVTRSRRSSRAELEYDQRLLSAEVAERMLLQFESLCDKASSAPEFPIGVLDILGEAERRHLRDISRSPGRGIGERVVHQLIEDQAARTPDSIALEACGFSISYGDLSRRTDQLARQLRSAGVEREVRVAICLERSPEMVMGVLGVLKAGGAYLPVDPHYPTDRIAFMLENARASVVLTRHELLDYRLRQPGLRILTDLQGETPASGPSEAIEAATSPLDLAYIIYTSGSTGKPKGVMIPHQGLSHYLQWCLERYGVSKGERVPLHSPLGFDLSVTSLFCPLLVGGTLVLVDEESEIDSLVSVINGPSEFRFLKLTPAHLDALGPLLSSAEAGRTSRTLILGGEALVSTSIERWRRYAPDDRLINEYGPTEATVGCCTYEIPSESSLEADAPIGRPISGSQAYVLDPDLKLLPSGVVGELYLGGPGLARGYADRAGATAEKFVPNPYADEPGARIYGTGDRARWRADGNLDFLGRTDNQVKLRGFRIEPGEVESVLREHPSVQQAVVAVREDPPAAKRLTAYIVPGADAAGSSAAMLRRFLETKLPGYMIPSTFVLLEALPLSPNGKVDREALPPPMDPGSRTRTPFVAPRTAMEKELARLWSEVLGVERVGTKDNFFELGGDSILLIQVVAKARRANLALTPLSMFEHQTIEELAALVGSAGGMVLAEQGAVEGPVPLTPIQRWFFDLDWSEPHHFNQASLLEVPRDLDPALLRESLAALVRHHDALRLRFERTESGWRQKNVGLDAVSARQIFSHIVLAALPGEEQRPALESAVAQLHRGLDLAKGPLLRAALFSRRGESDRLMIVIHHLVVDGVSWGILTEDLLLAYQQLHRGRPVELPPKTTSFRRWAERLSEYGRSSQELGEELHFWKGMGSESSEPLPVDRERGANDFASSDIVEMSMSADDTRALLREAPKAYRTQMIDLLLTALVEAFADWTGKRSLLVDLEGHGREDLFEDVDVTRTVGWFTTLSPVRLHLEATGDPGDAIKSIKEQLRRVPRRGIGYGLLTSLYPDEKRRHELRAALSPEVCFNYLGQFGNTRAPGSPYGAASESRGPLESPQGRRSHLIEINGSVTDGRFQARWRYSRNRHERATIEGLSRSFVRSLKELIAHCRNADVGGVTPADFPLAGVDQKTLERLVGNGREVEDLYPLSPTQQGLLFHTLYAPRSAVYFEQVSVRLSGELDVAAFREAWRRVVERHAVLRTAFAWEDLEEPLSIVRRNVDLPWEEQDWRGASATEDRRRLEGFLDQDRKKGFDLTEAPLMRLAVLRVEEDAWYLVWSHHHLLLDGWSVPLLLKEVLLALEGIRLGRELAPEPSRPYRDFISWLKQQDIGRAEAFWRRRLRGFRTPTSLPAAAPGERGLRDQVNYQRRDRIIPATTTSVLQGLGRENHLSLNTWIQGAWALLLAERSGRTDVVFGVTSAGRPVALSGFESMVGMFVTTLPARFDVSPEQDLLPWLQTAQRLQVEGREYEYASLIEMHRWSEVPAGTPLFETQQVFENYPVDGNLDVGIASKVQMTEHRSFTRSSYPVTLVSSLVGEELALKILFDTDRYDDGSIDAALDDLATILTRMAEDPRVGLGELGAVLGERSRLRRRKKEQELSVASLRLLNRARREAIPHRKDE
jgi:amino acid adenylation domain-containing protein/non-ribosomal peptide synthase protein (TIGR01720 family)